jgi:guanylate kinase
MRPGEVNGVVYHFLSNAAFDAKIARGDFLEWAIYGGNRYGTLLADVLAPIADGKVVVDELESQGVRSLQHVIPPENLRILYIDAGSWSDLQARILSRAHISPEELEKRREHYEDERTFMPQAFRIVQNANGGLAQAKEDFIRAVEDAIAS